MTSPDYADQVRAAVAIITALRTGRGHAYDPTNKDLLTAVQEEADILNAHGYGVAAVVYARIVDQALARIAYLEARSRGDFPNQNDRAKAWRDVSRSVLTLHANLDGVSVEGPTPEDPQANGPRADS
jgi:hypothetical protein